MKAYLLLAVVILSVILFSGQAFAGLTCTLESFNSCSDGTILFAMSNNYSAHAEKFISRDLLNYNKVVCCRHDIPDVTLSNSCSNKKATVLMLSDVTNAHVEEYPMIPQNYDTRVCISTPSEQISYVGCVYATACTGEYDCLASIKGTEINGKETNAHVANCSRFSEKVCCAVVYDNVKPIVGAEGAVDEWTKDPVEASVFCEDVGDKPFFDCDESTYKLLISDTNEGCPDSYSSYIEADGEFVTDHSYVCAAGKDNAGLFNHSLNPVEFKVDSTPPVTTDDVNDDGYGYEASVTLSCADTASGCRKIAFCNYTESAGDCTPYSLTNDPGESNESVELEGFSCSTGETCEYFIKYNSTDQAGNSEGTKGPFRIFLDGNLPSCDIWATGLIEHENSNYSNKTTITLEWSGSSGVGYITNYKIKYKLNDSDIWEQLGETYPNTTKTHDFTIENSGGKEYDFQCEAQDNFSKWEGGSPISIRFDLSAPIVNLQPLSALWTKDPIRINWSGIDAFSGIKNYTVYYNFSDQEWEKLIETPERATTYTNMSLNHGRKIYFKVKAEDNIGHVGESNTANISIDTVGPTCTITDMPETVNKTNYNFNITVSGNDPHSGIKDYIIYYKLGESTSWTNNRSLGISTDTNIETDNVFEGVSDGIYFFKCIARDNLGTEGAESEERNATIDVNPPEIDSENIEYPEIMALGENYEINVNVTDGIEIKDVNIVFSDEDGLEKNATKVNNNFWMVTWTLTGKEQTDIRSFNITAEDTSGNKVTKQFDFEISQCEPNSIRECWKDTGICEKGNMTCYPNGTWSPCENKTEGRNETCNGIDDDCNGIIDNDPENESKNITRSCGSLFLGRCSVGIATCRFDASVGCDDGECWVGCPSPQTEQCGNGKDDDCDGETDEDCECDPGDTQRCGETNVGVCEYGEQTCPDSGDWGDADCLGAINPIDEVGDALCSNGLDDDCDGRTDMNDPDCIDGGGGGQIDHCSNGMWDADEEDVDCGGVDCISCDMKFFADMWWIFILIGGIVLAVILYLYFKFKGEGKEVTWEELRYKYGRGTPPS